MLTLFTITYRGEKNLLSWELMGNSPYDIVALFTQFLMESKSETNTVEEAQEFIDWLIRDWNFYVPLKQKMELHS